MFFLFAFPFLPPFSFSLHLIPHLSFCFGIHSSVCHTDTCTHTLHHCVFSGHLTLSEISNLRGGILCLITLTRGSACTAACRGSWLEARMGYNWCGKRRESARQRGGRGREKVDYVAGMKVWEIWVKRTVWGWVGWGMVWAGVGVQGWSSPSHVPRCPAVWMAVG